MFHDRTGHTVTSAQACHAWLITTIITRSATRQVDMPFEERLGPTSSAGGVSLSPLTIDDATI